MNNCGRGSSKSNRPKRTNVNLVASCAITKVPEKDGDPVEIAFDCGCLGTRDLTTIDDPFDIDISQQTCSVQHCCLSFRPKPPQKYRSQSRVNGCACGCCCSSSNKRRLCQLERRCEVPPSNYPFPLPSFYKKKKPRKIPCDQNSSIQCKVSICQCCNNNNIPNASPLFQSQGQPIYENLQFPTSTPAPSIFLKHCYCGPMTGFDWKINAEVNVSSELSSVNTKDINQSRKSIKNFNINSMQNEFEPMCTCKNCRKVNTQNNAGPSQDKTNQARIGNCSSKRQRQANWERKYFGVIENQEPNCMQNPDFDIAQKEQEKYCGRQYFEAMRNRCTCFRVPNKEAKEIKRTRTIEVQQTRVQISSVQKIEEVTTSTREADDSEPEDEDDNEVEILRPLEKTDSTPKPSKSKSRSSVQKPRQKPQPQQSTSSYPMQRKGRTFATSKKKPQPEIIDPEKAKEQAKWKSMVKIQLAKRRSQMQEQWAKRKSITEMELAKQKSIEQSQLAKHKSIREMYVKKHKSLIPKQSITPAPSQEYQFDYSNYIPVVFEPPVEVIEATPIKYEYSSEKDREDLTRKSPLSNLFEVNSISRSRNISPEQEQSGFAKGLEGNTNNQLTNQSGPAPTGSSAPKGYRVNLVLANPEKLHLNHPDHDHDHGHDHTQPHHHH